MRPLGDFVAHGNFFFWMDLKTPLRATENLEVL